MWAKNGTRSSGAWALRPIGDELQMRDQKRAEQIRRLLPYPSLGQIGDENAAVLHRVRKVELRRVLAENGAQRRRGGELPDFVENGPGRLGAVALVVLRVLPYPKPRRDRIAHARDQSARGIARRCRRAASR